MAKSRARPPLCFGLIKSLERAEKTHFRRYARLSGRSEPAIYLRIFEELDKMKEYDPERLEQQFEGEKFLKRLPTYLHNLYDILLSSLVNFHSEKDDVLTAYEMLGEIRILFQKRLYDQCERQVRRARRYFEQREYYRYLYLLASYEYSLTVKQMRQGEIMEVRHITKERRTYLRKLDDELLIFDFCDQLRQYYREKQLNPNRDFTEEIADTASQLKELQSKFETGSTTFKLSLTRATEFSYYVDNQIIKSLKASHRYIRLRRNLPENLRYSDGADLDAMINHIIKSIEMWFANEVEYWLPELQVIRINTKNLRYRVDIQNWHFRFQILLIRGKFDELADLVNEMINELDVLFKKNVTYYNIMLLEDLALYHFLTGNFQESLAWINRVFEQKDMDKSLRRRINMWLIEIMIYFNLGNYRLALSRCRSFQHSIKITQQTNNEFIEEKKWANKINRLQNNIAAEELHDFIKPLLPESYFALPPNIRIVLMSVWAQAHLKDISLSESWTQHSAQLTAEMKSTTGMDVLCFADMEDGDSSEWGLIRKIKK